MVVHKRVQKNFTLKNLDSRVEPFTYPLFFSKGRLGFSVDMPIKTPYASRQHLTRFEMAQYRIAFPPHLTKNLHSQADCVVPDMREIKFNALHFGGRLFQQYLVDTYVRVERDRIQWIKNNQKKIHADKYIGVTRFLQDLEEKNNADIGESIILPSSFPGLNRDYGEHFEDAVAIVRCYALQF